MLRFHFWFLNRDGEEFPGTNNPLAGFHHPSLQFPSPASPELCEGLTTNMDSDEKSQYVMKLEVRLTKD